MKNLKDFFGKNVISLSEGVLVGYILNVCFDDEFVSQTGYIVCDGESEEELFLPCDKVKVESEDGIFIDGADALEINFYEESFSPMGKLVFSVTGENLGRVKDIILQGNRVVKLITDKAEICHKNISVVGRDYVIFSKNGKKNKKNIKINDISNIKQLPKVEIMSALAQQEKALQISSPAKVSVTPSMILNKTATADIIGLNNELILKKGEIITQKTLEKAKKHNKLNYLIFNSK